MQLFPEEGLLMGDFSEWEEAGLAVANVSEDILRKFPLVMLHRCHHSLIVSCLALSLTSYRVVEVSQY